jgi:hypothetical protein
MTEPHNDFPPDPDGLAFDLHLAKGANPPRSAVRAVWAAIADGKACDDTKIQWVEHIANRVHRELLENYDSDDRQRGSKALRALGLYGKVDGRYADDRSFVEDLYLSADAEGRDIKITPAFIMRCRYPDFQGTKKERRNLHKRLGEIIKEAREDANYTKACWAKKRNRPDIIELLRLTEDSPETKGKTEAS